MSSRECTANVQVWNTRPRSPMVDQVGDGGLTACRWGWSPNVVGCTMHRSGAVCTHSGSGAVERPPVHRRTAARPPPEQEANGPQGEDVSDYSGDRSNSAGSAGGDVASAWEGHRSRAPPRRGHPSMTARVPGM